MNGVEHNEYTKHYVTINVLSSYVQTNTRGDAAALALDQVMKQLETNPYSDVLKYRSTKSKHYFKDKDDAIVNKHQKPISLYLQLLKMFATPSTVVLDATAGTGTLTLAALELQAPQGLQIVAFERNQYQADNCVQRLERSCITPTSLDGVLVDHQTEVLAKIL